MKYLRVIIIRRLSLPNTEFSKDNVVIVPRDNVVIVSRNYQ